jgi:O-antigen/teichoic acid export membrane protein
MAYAMLITSIAAFNIKSNLLYFIPHDPKNKKTHVSHTTLMTLVASVVACLVLWVFRDTFLANTSFDFFLPLAIYILLFLNLDFLETYWLANKQPGNVMYFSVARTIVRLGGVIGTAIVTHSAVAMMYALCVIEVVRVIVVVFLMKYIGLLNISLHKSILQQQLSFVVPLGISGSLHYASLYIGQIAISMYLGVIALAIYTIANYQIPILNIIRGAIGDSIFPDMVTQANNRSGDRLALWKRANVAYASIIVPIFAIVAWYADILIPWVFTDKYVDAVPLFRVLATVMVIQCFEFSSPLRAISNTKMLLIGNILMLSTNVAVLLVFFRYFSEVAIFGPAVGIVSGYMVQLTYFGWAITENYNISVSQLLKWRSLAMIVLCTLAACVPLVAGEYVAINDFARLFVFSVLFCIVYWVTVRYMRLAEVETVIRALNSKLRRNAG